MIEIRSTEQYWRWYDRLRDREAQARILIRLRRLSLGNFGDVAPVGEVSVSCESTMGPDIACILFSVASVSSSCSVVGTRARKAKDILAAKVLALTV